MPEGKITDSARRVIESARLRPDERLDNACQRVAVDALYETRNDGGTMHDAGIAAGEAARAMCVSWLERYAEQFQNPQAVYFAAAIDGGDVVR